MKKMLYAITACMLLIALCACGGAIKPKDERWPVTVGQYTFTQVPKRVVSLSPAMTDTLYALGYGGRVAGVSDYCELPDAGRDAVQCGTVLLPDADVILQLKPDMLFTSAPLPSQTSKRLEEAAVKIVVVEHAETLEKLLENYRLICTAFEGEKTGVFKTEQLDYFARTTLDYIQDSVKQGVEPEKNAAVYLRQMPAVLATGDSFEGELLEYAGFVNKGASATGWYFPLEELATVQPDYIFCDESIGIESLRNSDYYKQSPAVANGAVFTFDAKVFERQSPAVFLAYESLVAMAFPEQFETAKPSVVMPMPEPEPEPEKSWWQKLFSK